MAIRDFWQNESALSAEAVVNPYLLLPLLGVKRL
jgi:hypothetical protein